MIRLFEKIKNKLLNFTKLEENSDEEDLSLDDICFYDEDGRLQELIQRREAKIIYFLKALVITNILIFMCFLLLYSLTFNSLFIVLLKIIIIIISVIVIIKPEEMWSFFKDICNS